MLQLLRVNEAGSKIAGHKLNAMMIEDYGSGGDDDLEVSLDCKLLAKPLLTHRTGFPRTL